MYTRGPPGGDANPCRLGLFGVRGTGGTWHPMVLRPQAPNPCRTAAVPAADGHQCISRPSYKASPIPRFVLFRFLFLYYHIRFWLIQTPFRTPFGKPHSFIVNTQSLLIKYVVYIAVNPFCPFRSVRNRCGPATWPWPYAPARRFEARKWRREWSWNCVRGWKHWHGCPEW